MALFKYKPVDPDARVEAVQWNGGDHPSWAGVSAFVGDADHGVVDYGRNFLLFCKKSNRDVEVQPGDYIVREPDGDGFYPCAQVIFESKYEPE